MLAPDGGVDGKLEDLVDALHLLAAALDIDGAHLLCYALPLLRRYGRQALGFEEVDTGALRSKIGFETDEDERGCGAEVEDFRIPLQSIVRSLFAICT